MKKQKKINKPLILQKKKVENEERIAFKPNIIKNNLYYDKIKVTFMKEIIKFFLPNKNLLKIIIKEKKKNLKK